MAISNRIKMSKNVAIQTWISRILYSTSAYRSCMLPYRLRRQQLYQDIYEKRLGETAYMKGADNAHDILTEVYANKQVISVVTECHFNPGLCDKLRAILSIYQVCKKTGIPYHIFWDYPFNLCDYLLPNQYDWSISNEDVFWDSRVTVCEIERQPNLFFSRSIERHTVTTLIKTFKHQQLHIYSNTRFGEARFSKSFDELFKPSPRLQDELDGHLKTIGGGYISVSLRFMELLGDFKDQEAVSQSLPEDEQEALIERCMEQLKRIIHREAKGRRVFVASDSRKFLDRAATLPEVYSVPGDIVHVRYRGSEEAYMKTFVDLLLLRGADKRFLLKTGKMYNSFFPRFASWIGNGKFCLINF